MLRKDSAERLETVRAPRYLPENVVVAIPTLNEAWHIEACIRSLIEGSDFASKVSVVVTDGGSTDGTQDIVRHLSSQFPRLSLISNPARFQSAGVNEVVNYCAEPTHRILVRCDAHAVYPEAYIQRIVETFERQPNAASVTTVMDATGSSCFQRAAAWVIDTPLGSGGSPHRGSRKGGWVDHAHHAGFRLDWYRQIGGYDPTFTHNEDAEYDHRLGLAGGRVWLEPSIRLSYKMRPTLAGLMRQYWRYGRGRARTVTKHSIRPRLRQLIPALNLITMILATVIGLVWWPALLWPAFYFSILAIVSAVGVVALGSSCGVFAGLVLATVHNCWAAGFLWQIMQVSFCSAR